jgi:hypothetical protein
VGVAIAVASIPKGLALNPFPLGLIFFIDNFTDEYILGMGVFKVIGTIIDKLIYEEDQLNRMKDDISDKILKIVEKSNEPLDTNEIIKAIPNATRSKIMYRLMDLRAEGKIHGKMITSGGKGVWVWWP